MIFLLVFVVGVCDVFGVGGEYAGGFMDGGFGVRSLALGGATVADARYPLDVHYNPAGILFSPAEPSFEAYYILLPLDKRMGGFGATYDLKGDAALGFGWINSYVSDLIGRDIDGNETGEIKNSENLITLTFCKRVGSNISLGGNINYVHANLYSLSTYAVGVDVGISARLFKGKLFLGGAYRNSGLTYSWNSSSIYEYGANVNEHFRRSGEFGVAWRDSFFVPFELLLAGASAEGDKMRLKLGGETRLFDILSLRAGFNGKNPTFGFSVFRQFNRFTLELCYAYLFSPLDLPSAHTFGLFAKF